MQTVEKYVIGVAYAAGNALFDRGAEPIQTLKRLFSARDTVVHPKPRSTPPAATPSAAAEFLVAAATAAQPLIELAGSGEVICKLISDYPAIYIDWGKRWTGTLPPLDAPAAQNLTAKAAERRFKKKH